MSNTYGSDQQFIFDANARAGDPLSYQSLVMRRKIAEALAKRSPFPKTLGEGLTYAGEKFADAMDMRGLDDAERRARQYDAAVSSRLPDANTYPADTSTAVGTGTGTRTGTSTGAGTAAAPSTRTATVAPSTIYAPGDAQPGGIPLPPPRPVFDRSSFQAEREANPSLDARMQTIVQGEVGHGATPEEKKIQLEAIFNRAAARGQTLERVTQQYTGPRSTGYYPATTFANGAARGPQEIQDFQRDIMTPVLRGSDVGGQALGFPPTGNASGGVASSGIASGLYNKAGRLPGGAETYVQQESPAGVARLNASRLPPRDAITQALTPPPVLSQGDDDGSPPPAGPTQTAALQPPGSTATDARQPAPNLNPMTLTDIAPAPRAVVAQNPALGASPGTEPIPGPVQPYKTEINPDPGPRPRPLAEFPASILAKKALRDPMIDPNGPAATAARDVIDRQEKIRAELDRQQQAEWEHKRAQRDAQIQLNEKRNYDEPGRILKDHIDRVGLEKAQADLEEAYYKRGIPRQQAATQAALDIQKAAREANKPDTFMAQGTQYRIPYNPATGASGPAEVTPGAPAPEKKPLTVEQAKAVTFVRDVLPDMDLLETKLDHGSALANSLGSSIGSSVPWLGNVLATQKYLEAQNAIGRFRGAVMNMLSGSAVSESEAERNLPAFIPRYGDSREEVLRKAERRRNYVNAVRDTAGDAGVDVIERGRQLIMRSNGELPPVRVSTPEEAKNLGAGQIIILPNGDKRTVPWPANLLPK